MTLRGREDGRDANTNFQLYEDLLTPLTIGGGQGTTTDILHLIRANSIGFEVGAKTVRAKTDGPQAQQAGRS